MRRGTGCKHKQNRKPFSACWKQSYRSSTARAAPQKQRSSHMAAWRAEGKADGFVGALGVASLGLGQNIWILDHKSVCVFVYLNKCVLKTQELSLFTHTRKQNSYTSGLDPIRQKMINKHSPCWTKSIESFKRWLTRFCLKWGVKEGINTRPN